MSIARLLAGADAIVRAADDLSAVFARQLALVLRETERQLLPLVLDASDRARTGIVRATRANRTRVEIRDILRTAGYDDMVDAATGSALDVVVETVLDLRKVAEGDGVLSASAAQKIEGLKALQMTDLLDAGDTMAGALWRATIRGVFGTRSHEAIIADLVDVLDLSEPRVRTLYDTSVSIFGRQVEALQAGDSPDAVFVFMGPADKKNRPFCHEHVGKVYTRSEIDTLDNGQLNDVFLTGGGYNCRHVWTEVSKFSDLMDLLDTDRRMPEIERQLERLAALEAS